MIRAYVPTTMRGLAALSAFGEIAAVPLAHAVTDAVRAEWRESSEEEWEYEALCLAADDCAEAWTADDVRRRVVLAVDLDDADVERAGGDDPDPTQVRVSGAVPLRRVAAIHADLSVEDAERGDDLCWFATQELHLLLP